MRDHLTGRDLRLLRVKNRVTIMTAANRLGITSVDVSAVEMGHADMPTGDNLAAWLNHIAPDGEIPVVPNDKDGKHE